MTCWWRWCSLAPANDQQVLTGNIVNLMGSAAATGRSCATSAFVSIAVPLVVFFSMQRFLVRGLLAGSVK